jgi:SPP1 gp7 family putative phage head morphogenesis protein
MINQDRLKSKFSQVEDLLTSVEASTVKSMNKTFAEALIVLEKKLLKTYPKYLSGDTLATIRAKRMIAELSEYIVLYNPSAEASLKEKLNKLITTAMEQGVNLGNFQMEELEKGVVGFKAKPETMGTKIMAEAATFITENSMLRLNKHSQEFANEATSLLSLNITLGIPTKATASALKQRFGVAQSKAVTIARTETMHGLNESVTWVAKKNGLDAVQYFATEDKDTCPYCIGRNQKIYLIGEIQVPLHPRCRCFLQPFSSKWIDKDGDFWDSEWSEEYYEDTKKKSDLEPTNAPSHFEKISGLKSAPVPLWTPDRVKTKKAP